MNAVALVPLLLLTLSSGATGGEKYETDPKKWKVVELPDRENLEKYYASLDLANHAVIDWTVQTVEGRVVAKLREGFGIGLTQPLPFDATILLENRMAEPSSALKVDDGWIVAYNEGEFGSAVYWYSEDGKQKAMLSRHQINGFLVEEDRTFAVEGLSHMGWSKGSMIEIKKSNGKWVVEEFLRLPGSGQAIARVARGDYVVVTSGTLLRVNLAKELLVLIPDGEWDGLYPNSVAVEDGQVFVGMRQFVVRCRLGTSVQTFQRLVPHATWLNKKKP